MQCVSRTGTRSSYCGRYQVSVMGMASSLIRDVYHPTKAQQVSYVSYQDKNPPGHPYLITTTTIMPEI